ncbi:MAG: hypothetical protein V1685_06570 [Parcubacteria group bacterium]
MKLVWTITIFIIGLVFFTFLLKLGLISGTVYASLLGLSLLIAVVFPNIDRLKELDIKNMRAVLSEIKKESHIVKVLSGDIAELITLNGLFQGRWGDERTTNLRKQINEKQISRALSALESKASTERIAKYRNIFNEIDAIGSVRNDDSEKDRKLTKIKELNKELAATLEEHIKSFRINRNGI